MVRSVASSPRRAVSSRTGAVSVRLDALRGEALTGSRLLEHYESLTVVPPEIAAINARVEAAAAGTPRLDEVDDAERARAGRAATFSHEPRRRREAIGGGVDVAIFSPLEKRRARGVYLHFHGGGWVIGSAFGQSDARLQKLADDSFLHVVSVDYALAPEHRWPKPLEDCVAAFEWLAANAEKRFGTTALTAGGESSGAHLCVAAYLQAPSRASYRALNLVYGFYDLARTRAFARRLVFTAEELEWFAEQLEPDAARRASPDVSPLRADLPPDLPPALFSVGTADALLDDTLLLAQRWTGDAELVVYPGAAHGLGHFGPHEATAQGADLNGRVAAFLEAHADPAPCEA